MKMIEDAKKEKMIEYIRSMAELDNAMQPYKDQKKELKQDFIEKKVLTKEEIALLTRAYAMAKKGEDTDSLGELLEMINEQRVRGKIP